MGIHWIVFECFINFWEMFTSCFLAAKIFQKELEGKKEIFMFLLFVVSGAALLTLRTHEIFPVSDWVPSVVTVALYAFLVCHAKIWIAVLCALLNYLMIGLISLSMCSVLSLVTNTPLELLNQSTEKQMIVQIMVRVGQVFATEVVQRIIRRIKKSFVMQQRDMGLMGISVLSIIALMFLWNTGEYLTEENIPYFTIFICLLILVLNFFLLFLKEILSREKHNNKELQEQNRIISMQIRNQNEINEMYHNMRALKHDMNNHLHTISGYIQTQDFKKAETYIQKIAGEISRIEAYQSGNPEIDALIGSKSALAKKNGIHLEIDISVPSSLQISAEHLSIILGNLYDNAIDANLKIEEKEKRYINIRILMKNTDLIVSFENAAIDGEQADKVHWPTTKKAAFEHGFGLKNIDRIVQLYDGYCFRELKNNVFVCRIRIPNENR